MSQQYFSRTKSMMSKLVRMSLLMLIFITPNACRDKIQAQRIHVDKQDQGQLVLPSTNSPATPFNLSAQNDTAIYSGNSILWNDHIDVDYALQLSQLSRNDRELKANALLGQPAVTAQVKKRDGLRDEIANLKNEKVATQLAVIDQKTRNWWQDQLNQLPEDGVLVTQSNKQLSQDHFERYCEATIWKFAVNALARDYLYNARPTPLNLCEPVFEKLGLLDTSKPLCQNAAEGGTADYFACFWIEGVARTSFFKEMFLAEVQDTIVKDANSGDLKQTLKDNAAQVDLLLDGKAIFTMKDGLKDYPTPNTFINFTFADPKDTAKIGAAQVRNPSELKKLILGRSVHAFSYLLASETQVRDPMNGVKILGSSELLDPLVVNAANYTQIDTMLAFVKAYGERPDGISVNDNTLNLPRAYDIAGKKLTEFTVPRNDLLLENLAVCKKLVPEIFLRHPLDSKIRQKEAELIIVEKQTTQKLQDFNDNFYNPAVNAVPKQATFALNQAENLNAVVHTDLRVNQQGDVTEYLFRINGTESVTTDLNPDGHGYPAFPWHQFCITRSGDQVSCPQVNKGAITDQFKVHFNQELGQLTLSAHIDDAMLFGLTTFENIADVELCRLDGSVVNGLDLEIDMVSNIYKDILTVVTGDYHLKVPGAAKDRYRGTFQVTNFNQLIGY